MRARRKSPATPRRPRSASARSRRQRQAKLATGVPFLDHMLDQIARHGLIDLDIEGEGRPAHRRPPHRGGHRHHAGPGLREGARRQEGHPPLRPCLCAARRGLVARGDRSVRDAPGWNDVELHACAHRRVRRRSGGRVLPGFRQPRRSRCTSTTCAASTPTTRWRRCSRPSAARCAWRWSSIRGWAMPSTKGALCYRLFPVACGRSPASRFFS
jgi:hypothetical protein